MGKKGVSALATVVGRCAKKTRFVAGKRGRVGGGGRGRGEGRFKAQDGLKSSQVPATAMIRIILRNWARYSGVGAHWGGCKYS